ncbi:MAG: arginine--tRNA ligase [Nibricoccus sp.]
MPTIQTHLRDAFRAAIREVYSTDADPLLVPTQNENFGDYQCNAAMALAKQLKLKPRDVAEKIKASVKLDGVVDKLEIAGPGFINIYLSSAWVAEKLSHVATDPRLGVESKPNPQTVVVDYSAPNIAKEMHVGHLRSTIIGDAIARVLAFLREKLHPAKPPRRLGHAVRDAHRLPPRCRRV